MIKEMLKKCRGDEDRIKLLTCIIENNLSKEEYREEAKQLLEIYL